MTEATPVPAGYAPHTRRSPLTEPWEPLYARHADGVVCLAVELRQAHCNARGLAHGGLISALADNAMGLSAVTHGRTERPDLAGAVTVNLSIDFLDGARPGEWLEVIPHVLKCGRTLAFVECRVQCGARVVARGNATFHLA